VWGTAPAQRKLDVCFKDIVRFSVLHTNELRAKDRAAEKAADRVEQTSQSCQESMFKDIKDTPVDIFTVLACACPPGSSFGPHISDPLTGLPVVRQDH